MRILLIYFYRKHNDDAFKMETRFNGESEPRVEEAPDSEAEIVLVKIGRGIVVFDKEAVAEIAEIMVINDVKIG